MITLELLPESGMDLATKADKLKSPGGAISTS